MKDNSIKNGFFIAGLGVRGDSMELTMLDDIKTPMYGAQVLEDNFSYRHILVQYHGVKYICNKKDVVNIEGLYLRKDSAYTSRFQTERFMGRITGLALHSEDEAPTFVYTDELKLFKYWMKNGNIHKETGPALVIVGADSTEEFYFIDGTRAKNLNEYYMLLSKNTGNKEVTISTRDIESLSNIPHDSIKINP